MKEKILITGGCGFIGVNLVVFLLKKTDWKINILDNLSVGRREDVKDIKYVKSDRVKFIKGDIRNKKDVNKAIKECQFVVNLAAQTGVISSIENPLNDADINVKGIINLLEASIRNKISRFIQASSSAPLGEQKMPLNEEKIPKPLSPYGASKLAGEAYCSAYSSSYGLRTIVLRFSNVYGPKSYHKASVIAKFCKQVIAKQTLTIYGDGKQTRDFIYVEDLCKSIYLSLKKKIKNKFELFQIATGRETSINRLVSIIKRAALKYSISSNDMKVRYSPCRTGEVYRNYSDITKARRVLGFKPETTLSNGLEKTLQWFAVRDGNWSDFKGE